MIILVKYYILMLVSGFLLYLMIRLCKQTARIAALWKVMKSSDNEELMICIGRIIKELCSEAAVDAVQRKLLEGMYIFLFVNVANYRRLELI